MKISSLVVAFAAGGAVAAPTKSVTFESSTWEERQLPEGCEAAFHDTSAYLNFYEGAIAAMAAKRGAEGRGVVDLFSVSELRSEFQGQFPNLQEESPMDRLIIRQLCQYRQIRNAEFKPGMAPALLQITSADPGLHDHLAQIAPKLLKDAKQLMLEAIAHRTKLSEQQQFMASKLRDIQRARNLGKNQVKDLLQ